LLSLMALVVRALAAEDIVVRFLMLLLLMIEVLAIKNEETPMNMIDASTMGSTFMKRGVRSSAMK